MSYNCIIKQGDLLFEDRATFIVNASNTQLMLGSGVSMAFMRHCGIELQKEMDAQFNKVGFFMKKGDVALTSSANATNFEYALHVAVVDYNDNAIDKLPTLDNIYSALQNIESYLEWYSKEKIGENIKLVLPLMGCGVGGLDKQSVLKSYKSFFSREVSFDCEVVIYGHSKEDYELIKKVFENL